MTKGISNIEQGEMPFEGRMEYGQIYGLGRIQMFTEKILEEERKKYRKETERLGTEQYYKNIAIVPPKEDIQSIMGGFEWMKEIDIVDIQPSEYRGLIYGPELPTKPLTPPQKRLDIKLKSTHLEDQKDRLVKELALDQAEAQIISDMVRRLAEVKIKEAGKKWSESVKKAFANLMTAILIEETKAIKPQRSKRAMIGTNYGDISVCPV